MYTTSNFSANLANAIVSHMKENNVKCLPLSFLANRNDYGTCEIARKFLKANYEYLYYNENDELCVHKSYNDKYDYIVKNFQPRFNDPRNWTCILTADMVALVNITYDTIGSPYFNATDEEIEDYFNELAEIEAEETAAEMRRNEVA